MTLVAHDGRRSGAPLGRVAIRSTVGAMIAAATVTTLGSMPAGAAAPSLAQRVLGLTRPDAARVTSRPQVPRIPGIPNISKVTTASGNGTAGMSQVNATTTGISASYSGTTLVVNWDSGNSLTVSGAGPLASGSTVLVFGSIQDGNIAVGGGHACAAPSGLGAVTIDQLATTGSAVTTLALQFLCITSSPDFAVGGTVGMNVPPSTRLAGYNLFQGDGTVTSSASLGSGGIFGVDIFGDMSGLPLNQPVVGMATTPLDGGYWLVAGDGGVFSFGDAAFYGSTGNIRLNKPVLGMAATPDGGGYWFVASDGGVFSYGDAGFYGSTGNIRLNKPIVGMAATPDGRGYWLVASDGGIFSFGDAAFYGSTGNIRLNQPIVGMAPTPDGRGYWLVASDGGIFTFGDAGFYGSTGNIRLNQPIVGMAATADGNGYWLAASDGGVFTFGDAAFDGSLGGTGTTDVAGIAR